MSVLKHYVGLLFYVVNDDNDIQRKKRICIELLYSQNEKPCIVKYHMHIKYQTRVYTHGQSCAYHLLSQCMLVAERLGLRLES